MNLHERKIILICHLCKIGLCVNRRRCSASLLKQIWSRPNNSHPRCLHHHLVHLHTIKQINIVRFTNYILILFEIRKFRYSFKVKGQFYVSKFDLLYVSWNPLRFRLDFENPALVHLYSFFLLFSFMLSPVVKDLN